MAKMVAVRSGAGFEFFAQQRQKSLAHKKARPDCSGAGCEVQGKLETLEKINGGRPFRRVS
jgi:hypothetical protein